MATQETIKQISSGGTLRDIEDAIARQTLLNVVSALGSLQNALDAMTNSDTTTAIETFHEVIDFLSGVTDSDTLVGKLNELRTLINGKVTAETGKGLSSNDYTDADKTKLAGIAAGAEVNVIDGIIVGNTEVQPVNKKVTIPAGADGITPHIGANGNWFIGETDTGIHAQGPAGTSYTSADLEISNALNGQGDVLGMGGAMKMKNNLDFVYGKLQALFAALGNIAFWDGKPSSANILPNLDWGNPKHTVTLALNLTNAVVKDSLGNTKSNGEYIQVEQGGTLTLTIEPTDSSYAFASAPSVSVGGNSVTPTDNEDGTYSVVITMGQSDIAVSISAIAEVANGHNVVVEVKKVTATASVTNAGALSADPPVMTSAVDTSTGCGVTGVSKVADGQPYSGTLNIASGYGLFSAKASMGGTDISDKINLATGAISIAAVTDDITITLTVAEAIDGMFLGKSFFDNNGFSPNVLYCGNLISGGVPTNASNPNDDWCCNSEFFAVPSGANKIKLVHGPILAEKTDTNSIQNKRGCLIVYNDFGVRVGHVTIYAANETQRIINWPLAETQSSAVSAYVRGSFIKNKLNVSMISFSTDGGTNWTDVFVGSEKDITTT